MTTETMNELKNHIMNRSCISGPAFSVRKIMKYGDAEPWAEKCASDIADDLLIDGDHVKLDILSAPPDILVDFDGIMTCEAVFKKYLPEGKCNDFKRYASCCTGHVECANEMIKTIRGYSRSDLQSSIRSAKKDTDMQQIYELLVAERASRHRWRKVFLGVKEWSYGKWIYLKNYRLLQFIKKSLHRIQKEEKEYQKEPKAMRPVAACAAKKDRREVMAAAYKRFVKAHNMPEYLTGDDLKRYVYLSVNYFARKRWSGRPLSGDTCEIRYFLIKPVMEALGRLTPVELQQMFPVEKEYDGEKCGCKDYFYTMNSLDKLDPDKPIGDEMRVGALLWDYQNNTLSCFFLQWMSCIDDLYIYAEKREKYEKFNEVLKNRCGTEG